MRSASWTQRLRGATPPGGGAVSTPDGRGSLPAGEVCAVGSARRGAAARARAAQGEDETFPNGFTIRAEKCPNRRGVAAGARCAGRPVDRRGTTCWRSRRRSRAYDAVWITGGYKTDWNDETTVAKLADTPLLIVQDLFPSPLAERADWQLPATAFAERSGSYVNRSDRLQTFEWADSSSARRAERRAVVVAAAGAPRLVQRAAGAGGSGRGDRLLLRRAAAGARRGCGSESQTAGVDV